MMVTLIVGTIEGSVTGVFVTLLFRRQLEL